MLLKRARDLTRTGQRELADGKLAAAETSFRAALAEWDQIVPKPPERARTLDELGSCLKAQCRLDDAIKCLQEALVIHRSSSGTDNKTNTGLTLYELGICLKAQNRWDDAIECLKEALVIHRSSCHDEANTAMTLHALAQCLMENATSLGEAEGLLKESLAIENKLTPINEVRRAETLHELGRCLSNERKLTEAERLLRQSLSVKRKMCTNDKATIATTLHILGLCLMKSNKLDEAEALLRESLDIRLAVCPDTKAEIASTLHELSRCLTYQGKYCDSEDTFRKCIKNKLTCYSDDSLTVATSRGCLAECLILQSKVTEGEALLRKALAVSSQSNDNFRKSLHSARLALSIQLQRESQEEINTLLQQAKGWVQFVSSLTDKARVLSEVGLVLSLSGEYAQADENLTEALKIQRQYLAKQHHRTALTLFRFGVCATFQGKLDDGIKYYQESADMMSPGSQHPLRARCLLGLDKLLRAKNKAKKPLTEAVDILRQSLPQHTSTREGETKNVSEGSSKFATEKKEDMFRIALEKDKVPAQPSHKQVNTVSPPSTVYRRGGTLGMMAVETMPPTHVAFKSVIGPLGGECGTEGILVRVPPGAVPALMEFSGEISFDSAFLLPTGSSKDETVLSSIVYLSPSGILFKEDVQLTLPTSTPFLCKHHDSGWMMKLKMCTVACSGVAEPEKWCTALTLNTATGEMTTHSPIVCFNPHRGIIQLQRFCGLCWVGHQLNSQSLVERTVSYVVFGKQLLLRKWIVYVHIMHGSGTQDVYKDLIMEKQSYVLLHPPRTTTIGQCGEVRLTVECTAPWKLCRESVDPPISTREIWNSPVNGAVYLTVRMEDLTGQSHCLNCMVTALFKDDWVNVKSVQLAISHPLDSGSLSGNSPAAAPTFHLTMNQSIGSSTQTTKTPNLHPDEEGSECSSVENCIINPDHIAIGVAKQLHISIPAESGRLIPSDGCLVQFSSEKEEIEIKEVPGTRRNELQVMVLSPAWPVADEVFVRIVTMTNKEQLGIGILNVGEFTK